MLSFKYRIKKRKEFDDIFRNGKKFENQTYLIKVKENNLDFSRFAFVVPVKIYRKAVVRNTLKRKKREAVRSVFKQIEKGFDVIVISKKDLDKRSYKEIKEGVVDILQKAKVIKS